MYCKRRAQKKFVMLLALVVLVTMSATNRLWAGDHMILVSTFSESRFGDPTPDLPGEWKIKIWAGSPDVRVLRGQAGPVLRLRSQRSSVAIHKELEVDLQRHAVLSWEWKVTALPSRADARNSSLDDQAAGLYVVFPRFPAFINSRIIGYVWESTAPEGLVLPSRNNSQIHYIVVESGPAHVGIWQREARDVKADYTMIFGEAPPLVGGVSLMIDTDHTQSSAESFFGEIRFVSQDEELMHGDDS